MLLLYERSWHEAADMIFTKSFTIRGEASNLPILTKALYVNLYTKAIQYESDAHIAKNNSRQRDEY